MHAVESARTQLKIYLFGCLEIWRGNILLPPLATHKTQSLLAYLVINRHQSHPREKLASLLWGDSDEAHAHQSLATALWRIRKQLGEDRLTSDSLFVQFDFTPDVWLDVAEFEELTGKYMVEGEELSAAAVSSLENAIDVYRDEFLAGFYDNWCIEERYRLEMLYLKALKRLITWHDRQGNDEKTLSYAQKYLKIDSLDERIHLKAMRCLAALGDTTGARRHWQICCEARYQELREPPTSEMIDKAKKILGDLYPALLSPSPTREKDLRYSGDLEHPPFVGRNDEINYLATLWEQGTRGKGGVVFIGGEAGIGKTRLTEELAAMVRWQGGSVAWGHCYEPERCLPLEPLREILQELRATKIGMSLKLADWEKSELARLLPEFEVTPLTFPQAFSSVQTERQAILFEAMLSFLDTYARQSPLLMVIEDIHWAGDSTLAAINFLIRRIGDLPIFLLLTFRPEEMDFSTPLSRMISRLTREGEGEVILLKPLSAEAVLQLVQGVIRVQPDEEFVNRLYEHSEGNPFYTIETLRALGEISDRALPITRNVQTLILSRIGQLSPLARQMISIASVAGRVFEMFLLTEPLGLDEDMAMEGIDELLRRGFVQETESGGRGDFQFVHHLVQEVAYTSMHWNKRRRLHHLIAETLENQGRDQAGCATILAYHYEAGGDLGKALTYHTLAAQQDMAVCAWQDAERHQSCALHLLDRLDPDCSQGEYSRQRGKVYADRADVRYLLGRLGERDSDLIALNMLAKFSQDVRLRLQACCANARYLNLDACYERAIATAQEGLRLAEQVGDEAAQCYLLSQIGFAHYFMGEPEPALAAIVSALENTPEFDHEKRRHLLHVRGYIHYHLGNYAEALQDQQVTCAYHHEVGDYNGVVWAGLDIGAAYREMAQLAEAEYYLTEHVNLARRIGARTAESYGLIQMGFLEIHKGNYFTGIDCLHQSIRLQQELRTEHGRVAAEMGLGFAHYFLGDDPAARTWFKRAIERGRSIRHRRRLSKALIGLGLVEISDGHLDLAHQFINEAVEIARTSEARGVLAAGLSALARVERRQGNYPAAEHHAQEAIEMACAISSPTCHMWGEVEMGLVLLALGKSESALQHTSRAVDLIPCSDEGWIGFEQVYSAHALALETAGRDFEAESHKRLACAVVSEKACRIQNSHLRQGYLAAKAL